MLTRFSLIAAATLVSAAAYAAQPSKPSRQPQTHSQPAPTVVPVALASADEVHVSPVTDPQAPQTPKRRIARVTTCRCGDPQAQPEQ